MLRAGTESGSGIAITCGAGINCVGVGPDGTHVRFPALGEITGDWGGGHDVGLAGLWAAARSEDGRGPKTELEQLIPEHFGYATPLQLARALHGGERVAAAAARGWRPSSSHRATPSRSRSATGSPTRSSRLPVRRSRGSGSTAGRSRCSSAAG